MVKVKGPNGYVWDLDPVVASGLIGSPSGDYEAVKDEPNDKSEGKSSKSKK